MTNLKTALIHFIDELDIPDIEPRRHDEIEELTNKIWGRLYFTPFHARRERSGEGGRSGGSHAVR